MELFRCTSDIKETQMPRALSQASAPNDPNVFTFTLSLSRGQTGGAWEPSRKRFFFSPRAKVSLTSTMIFLCHVLFSYWFLSPAFTGIRLPGRGGRGRGRHAGRREGRLCLLLSKRDAANKTLNCAENYSRLRGGRVGGRWMRFYDECSHPVTRLRRCMNAFI
jgi:hypothetical protein